METGEIGELRKETRDFITCMTCAWRVHDMCDVCNVWAQGWDSCQCSWTWECVWSWLTCQLETHRDSFGFLRTWSWSQASRVLADDLSQPLDCCVQIFQGWGLGQRSRSTSSAHWFSAKKQSVYSDMMSEHVQSVTKVQGQYCLHKKVAGRKQRESRITVVLFTLS